MGNRLFVTSAHGHDRRSVLVLEGIDKLKEAPQAREVYSAGKLSTLAAEPRTQQVFFLSEEMGGLRVHVVDLRNAALGFASHAVPNPLVPLADHVPIAVMGAKIFGVFGYEDELCRIDLDANLASTSMREDAKRFSFNRYGQWVQVETTGIAFPHLRVQDELSHMERVRVQPVVVRDCAAAVGLVDGRILVYDLKSPPYHWDLRLSSQGHEITALSSFGRYLAAGDAAGNVKVFRLALAKGQAI
jgi:hypothetical protein